MTERPRQKPGLPVEISFDGMQASITKDKEAVSAVTAQDKPYDHVIWQSRSSPPIAFPKKNPHL